MRLKDGIWEWFQQELEGAGGNLHLGLCRLCRPRDHADMGT